MEVPPPPGGKPRWGNFSKSLTYWLLFIPSDINTANKLWHLLGFQDHKTNNKWEKLTKTYGGKVDQMFSKFNFECETHLQINFKVCIARYGLCVLYLINRQLLKVCRPNTNGKNMIHTLQLYNDHENKIRSPLCIALWILTVHNFTWLVCAH